MCARPEVKGESRTEMSRRARERPLAKWSREFCESVDDGRVIDLFAPIYKNSTLCRRQSVLFAARWARGSGWMPKSPRLQPRLTGWNIFNLQLMRASTLSFRRRRGCDRFIKSQTFVAWSRKFVFTCAAG